MTVVAIDATKDTYLAEEAATTNYGTATAGTVQSRATNRDMRALVTLDVTWGVTIPNGAVISAATLAFYRMGDAGVESAVGRTYWAYKNTRNDWVEEEATWNNYKAATAWSTAGGDYVTTSPAGSSLTVPNTTGDMVWDILAIVQDAQTNSININVVIKDGTEEYAGDPGTNFRLREVTVEAMRPTFTITYTIPVSAGGGVAAQCVMAGVI
jgi:hypothetical protein